MADTKAQKYLTALEKKRKNEERSTGVRKGDAQVAKEQKAQARKREDAAARRKANTPKPPAPSKPSRAIERPASTGQPPSKSSNAKSTPPRKGSPSDKRRPASSSGRSGGVSVGDVAGAVVTSGAAVATGKAISAAVGRSATTKPGFNSRGGASSTSKGYMPRPGSSGQVTRANENYGRQIRTGAAGSGTYGRPASQAPAQPGRPPKRSPQVKGGPGFRGIPKGRGTKSTSSWARGRGGGRGSGND
jgi:hypothetical protein